MLKRPMQVMMEGDEMIERTGTIEAVDMWRLGVWQMIDGGSMTDRCIPAETVTRWHG